MCRILFTMNLITLIGIVMIADGIFILARRKNQLKKWEGRETGLLISLFINMMLIYAGAWAVIQ